MSVFAFRLLNPPCHTDCLVIWLKEKSAFTFCTVFCNVFFFVFFVFLCVGFVLVLFWFCTGFVFVVFFTFLYFPFFFVFLYFRTFLYVIFMFLFQDCVNINAFVPGYSSRLCGNCGSSKWRRVFT